MTSPLMFGKLPRFERVVCRLIAAWVFLGAVLLGACGPQGLRQTPTESESGTAIMASEHKSNAASQAVEPDWVDVNGNCVIDADEISGGDVASWLSGYQKAVVIRSSTRFDYCHLRVIGPRRVGVSGAMVADRWRFAPMTCNFGGRLVAGSEIRLVWDIVPFQLTVSEDLQNEWRSVLRQRAIGLLEALSPVNEAAADASSTYRNPYPCNALYYRYTVYNDLIATITVPVRVGGVVSEGGIEIVVASIPVGEEGFLIRRRVGESIPDHAELGPPGTWDMAKWSTYVPE